MFMNNVFCGSRKQLCICVQHRSARLPMKCARKECGLLVHSTPGEGWAEFCCMMCRKECGHGKKCESRPWKDPYSGQSLYEAKIAQYAGGAGKTKATRQVVYPPTSPTLDIADHLVSATKEEQPDKASSHTFGIKLKPKPNPNKRKLGSEDEHVKDEPEDEQTTALLKEEQMTKRVKDEPEDEQTTALLKEEQMTKRVKDEPEELLELMVERSEGLTLLQKAQLMEEGLADEQGNFTGPLQCDLETCKWRDGRYIVAGRVRVNNSFFVIGMNLSDMVLVPQPEGAAASTASSIAADGAALVPQPEGAAASTASSIAADGAAASDHEAF